MQNVKVPERAGFVRVQMLNQGYVALPCVSPSKTMTTTNAGQARKYSLDFLVNFDIGSFAGMFGQRALYRFMLTPYRVAYDWRYREGEVYKAGTAQTQKDTDVENGTEAKDVREYSRLNG